MKSGQRGNATSRVTQEMIAVMAATNKPEFVERLTKFLHESWKPDWKKPDR
jgi:hypothetical protein